MESFLLPNLPYLRWHIIFVFSVSIIIWLTHYRYLTKYIKIYIWITILSIIWGYTFDMDALRNNLWFFNSINCLGIDIFNLQFEEWLFLIFVPQELTSILLLIKKYVIDHKCNKE